MLFYHGHGGDYGFSLGNPRQTLDPKKLYKRLAKLRGNKALIVDACRAGVFLTDHNKQYIPPNTLVIVACGPEGNAGETQIQDHFGNGMVYEGRLTKSLVKWLEENRETPKLFVAHCISMVYDKERGGDVAWERFSPPAPPPPRV